MLTGHYVFKPRDISPRDEANLAWGVLQMQNDYFGPFRQGVFKDLVDESVLPFLEQLEENYRPFPFRPPDYQTSIRRMATFSSIS